MRLSIMNNEHATEIDIAGKALTITRIERMNNAALRNTEKLTEEVKGELRNLRTYVQLAAYSLKHYETVPRDEDVVQYLDDIDSFLQRLVDGRPLVDVRYDGAVGVSE